MSHCEGTAYRFKDLSLRVLTNPGSQLALISVTQVVSPRSRLNYFSPENSGLRTQRIGCHEMLAHGFRSMASTCLNEQGWHPDLIELELAHAERNEVRGVYNRAQRLAYRTMLQALPRRVARDTDTSATSPDLIRKGVSRSRDREFKRRATDALLSLLCGDKVPADTGRRAHTQMLLTPDLSDTYVLRVVTDWRSIPSTPA